MPDEKELSKEEAERKAKAQELDAPYAKELRLKIKSMLAHREYTIEKMADELATKFYLKETKNNLWNKLKRGSLRYVDIQRIAEILDYEIDIRPKQK